MIIVYISIALAFLLGVGGMIGMGANMAAFGLILIVFARIIQAAEYQKQLFEVMAEVARRKS